MDGVTDEAINDLYGDYCCGTYSSDDGCCSGKTEETMIVGFEDYTMDLTEEERGFARQMYRYMKDKFNDGLPVTNRKIQEAMLMKHGFEVTAPRIRKIIAWMHINGHLPRLVASSNGYSWAEDDKALIDYAASLKGRREAIHMRYEAVMKTLNGETNGK
jgi:hypothetical protein